MKRNAIIILIVFAAFLIADSFNGGSSSGSGAMTQITKTVLGSPAANFTFSGIPATSNNLLITLDAASAGAVNNESVYIQFNADTGANYNFQQGILENTTFSGFNTAGVAGTANQGCVTIAGTSSPANESSPVQISIMNYAGTTFRKHALCTWGNNGADVSGSNSNNLSNAIVTWRNTAAITSIKLAIVSGNNFATGSTAILYGIN